MTNKSRNLEDLIELELNLKGITTKYTYEKLTELKSVIVLMVGKSTSATDVDETETLEYFIDIFDNVTRLTDSYLKLSNIGCDLFDDFSVTVYSDSTNQIMESNKASLVLQFNYQNKLIKIENRSESCQNCLRELCQMMEDGFQEWSKYVQTIRNEFESINHLTIKQIIILKNQLNQIIQNDRIDQKMFDQISALIFNISQNISIENFKEIIKNLFAESIRKCKEIKRKTKSLDKVSQFVQNFAASNNFSVKTVREAVNKFGILDQNEIMDYCFENDGSGYNEDDMECSDEETEAMDIDQKGI